MKRRKVLILNSDFQPLTAVSWQRGMRIFFERSCITLELARDANGVPVKIHSPNDIWDLPSVMMNSRYVSLSDGIRYSRYNCYQRDNYTCQYCGDDNAAELTIDHIRPKVKVKGREQNLWLNRTTACTKCNGQKGCRSLEEMRGEKCWNGKPFRLVRQPFEPNRASTSRFVRWVGRDNLEWLNYIPDWERAARAVDREWLIKAYADWSALQSAED